MRGLGVRLGWAVGVWGAVGDEVADAGGSEGAGGVSRGREREAGARAAGSWEGMPGMRTGAGGDRRGGAAGGGEGGCALCIWRELPMYAGGTFCREVEGGRRGGPRGPGLVSADGRRRWGEGCGRLVEGSAGIQAGPV